METLANHAVRSVENKVCVERRADQRFEVREGAIASLRLPVVGQIVNISYGGLAFRYVASHGRSKESASLSISLSDNTFNLAMMPFEVAWDVASPQSFSFGDIALRYCGVAFGDLVDYQRLALKYFVKHYRQGGAHG
jgi:hypothetical protein